MCVYDGYGNEHSASIINYPEENYATKAELISPENATEVEGDITFSWKSSDNNVTNFTLQISADDTFSKIKYSKDVEASGNGTTSTEITASHIGLGTYHWRVISKGNTYFDTPSDSRSFTITNIGIGETEEGYYIINDDASYSDVNNIHIENLWMRSVRDGFENITFPDDNGIGSWNRSMVAVGDYVYLSGRTANSSTATAYIDKYNGTTGEYIERITLGANTSVTFYPCNNIMKDSNGNVCISNLIIFNQGPLVIHHVDLESGNATQVASIISTTASDTRFDHVSMIGDVTTGNFTVFGVATNSAKVFRWKFTNGSYTESIQTISSFYPTSVKSFGLAPRVIPISEDDIFIDCSNTALTRYTFSTGVSSGSFLANTSVAPANYGNNGGTIIPLGNQRIVVYANSDEQTSPSHTFNVVTTTPDLTFSDMKQLWVLPRNGFGTVNSVTYQAAADYVSLESGKARLYLYVPGNGISAYEITDTEISGISDISIDNSSTKIEYYNLHGIKIAEGYLGSGIYIKKQGNKTSKVIIK